MPSHPCVFVNEPKLLDLKMILIQKHGLRAEFVGGVLNIEDTVAIKRVNPLPPSFHFSHIFSSERSRQNHSRRCTLRYLLQSSTNSLRAICDFVMIVYRFLLLFFFSFI